MKNSSCFFRNTECEFFPCHKVTNDDDFNCLFCYCPLYNMENCGGNYRMLPHSVKDCSDCALPHKAASYGYIMEKLLTLPDKNNAFAYKEQA